MWSFGIWNLGASFDQMTPNPKNGQMTRSFPNTAIYWYNQAVENGCQEAKESLDILLKLQNKE